MTDDDLDRLAQKARAGDEDAAHRLVEELSPMVARLARRRASNAQPSDLEGHGRLAVLGALRNWDEEVPFSAFARLVVSRAISKADRDEGSGLGPKASPVRTVSADDVGREPTRGLAPPRPEAKPIGRPKTHSLLRPRELEVLDTAARSSGAKEIGGRLGISPETVEWHLHKVYRTLDVPCLHLALFKAHRLGLIRLPLDPQ
jgi:DNA-binding CsgD family transcriptional regulator